MRALFVKVAFWAFRAYICTHIKKIYFINCVWDKTESKEKLSSAFKETKEDQITQD